MKIPLKSVDHEIEIKKSRFIASAIPCTSLSEVKELVSQAKAAHPGANHVIHAAVIGERGDEFSCSDDHEPKNTAGRPALEVLKGSGVTNVAILIIRYFGGTLLGTGGLVKAYGESARKVLELLETEELVLKCNFIITTSYNHYEPIKKILIEANSAIIDEQFTTEVLLKGTVAVQAKEHISKSITEISNGQDTIQFSEWKVY